MPARLKAIARALKESVPGSEVQRPKKGSSHWKAIGPDGKTYPIPAHNGLKTEIGDAYIRGLCTAFGLSIEEFKKRL